jgi:hypothetical protein
MAKTSFQTDIKPIFGQFVGPMMWRFDLSSYDVVKANISIIWARISAPDSPMPPPPYDPLSSDQLQLVAAWMDEGCPP